MQEDKRTADLLKKYLQWPVLFAGIMIAANITVLIVDQRAAMFMSGWTLVSILALVLLYTISRHQIMRSLVGFAMSTEEAQNTQVQDLDVPYALMDENGSLLWRNRRFNALVAGDKAAKKELTAVFPDIDPGSLAGIGKETEFHSFFRDHYYSIRIKRVEMDTEKLFSVFLYDESDYVEILTRWENARPAVGLIYLDNYEDAMEGVDEVRRSLIVALIDRKINNYISQVNGITSKLEKDKYLFLVTKEDLAKLEKDKFDILEDVKTVASGSEMKVTLSIGIGTDAATYAENYDRARSAIDMALGRGGDQAVLKVGDEIRYYGGKSQSIEKATRVKARVKAQAFRELLETKNAVFIMGHKLPDLDSVGAAVGIWRIARSEGHEAHIVIGEIEQTMESAMARFESGDYPEDMFLSAEEAAERIDGDSVLVVVDVNRPSRTEAPELLEKTRNIVVFDHHRQSSDMIDPAILSYVEPYASSACEMIAEIIQYTSEDIRLKSAEADVMYGGIVVDTNNFTNQAGVRTFEAAAFLRKCGADVTRVRRLSREPIGSWRAKAEAIMNAELYRGAYAISICDSAEAESPTVTAAQAANELLNIDGVKASFVLCEYGGQIYISARSMDEVNVQVIMEKMGGGGHRSVAGTQLQDVSPEEAAAQLKDMIDRMSKDGELEA